MSDIASRVKAIIVDKLGVDENEVVNEASFTNDLGADSLDTVELIMEFEKEFDIQIPDERAAEVVTVGQLYDSILEACPTRRSDDLCMSAATFRLIRRAMQSDLGLDVRRLRPRDSVDSVFPRDRRRQTWSRLADTLDLRFPKLVRPNWITASATIITVATGVGCGYLSRRHKTGDVGDNHGRDNAQNGNHD